MAKINPGYYAMVRRNLDSLVGKRLTNNEFRVLCFILNRTLRFHKEEERIPYRHFLKGVISRDGECITAAIPGDKRTIKRSLDSLKEKGLIDVRIGGDWAGSNFIRVDIPNLCEFIGIQMEWLSITEIETIEEIDDMEETQGSVW